MEALCSKLWTFAIFVIGVLVEKMIESLYEEVIRPWLKSKMRLGKKQGKLKAKKTSAPPIVEQPTEGLSLKEKSRVAVAIGEAELRVLKHYARKGALPVWRNATVFLVCLLFSIGDAYLIYNNVAYLLETPPENWRSFIIPVMIFVLLLPILFDVWMKSLAAFIVSLKLRGKMKA
jgi:hypothetical protein